MGLGNLLLIPGLGAAPLDIRARVGVSSSPTSTGNQAITGVGFQPKAVLPFGALCATSGVHSGGLLGLGAATSTSSEAAISASSQNGQTNTNTARRHTASASVSLLASTGVLFNEADIAAIGASGFTLNWSTVDPVSYLLNHICLGGADLEVSLTQHQLNGTNASQVLPHGLGGPPTGLLMFHAGNNALPPNTASVLSYGVGAWAGGSQWASRAYSNNGVTTTETRRELRNDCWYTGGTTTTTRTSAVSSVDATNVNVTYPVTSSTYQSYIWMLAIRGAKCQTGTFDCNGSTSPLTIPCSGITPKLFLPVFLPVGVDQIGIVQDGLAMTIGASDGVNTVSCGITDSNGLTTTNARRYQASSAFEEYFIFAGTKTFEAQCSFSGQSVVISPSMNADPNFGQGAYLIIGA